MFTYGENGAAGADGGNMIDGVFENGCDCWAIQFFDTGVCCISVIRLFIPWYRS